MLLDNVVSLRLTARPGLLRSPVNPLEAVAGTPAVPILGAAAFGILLDHYTSVVRTSWLWIAFLLLVVSAWWGGRRPIRAWLCLMLASAAIFAVRHHLREQPPPPVVTNFFSRHAVQPVKLRGRVCEPAWSIESRGWWWQSDPQPALSFILDRVHLCPTQGEYPWPGRVRIIWQHSGETLRAGDLVEVLGLMRQPDEPANPGDFDVRRWYARQRIYAVCYVRYAEALQLQGFMPTWWHRLLNWRADLRQVAIDFLQRHLQREAASLAEALLLGSRQQIPAELNMALRESGTLHVLAISGVNVAIIWLGLQGVMRWMAVSTLSSTLFITMGLGIYAWLTDANPPIVRAVVMAVVWQLAASSGRVVNPAQTLAVAALTLLLLQPHDLFHLGAQLSVLSVAALQFARRLWWRWYEKNYQIQKLETGLMGGLARGWVWGRDAFVQANLTTGLVWFVTAPLIVSQFHILPLAGFVLNVAIGPLVMVMLWSGYLWLVTLPISPSLSEWPLWLFSWSLEAFVFLARATAQLSWGHVHWVGPELWWLLGFYALLFWVYAFHEGLSRWFVVACTLWCVAGLLWCFRPPGDGRSLRCEFLAVGHGLAVVMHLPSGKTLVYDSGSMQGEERVAQTVARALWRFRKRRIDWLLLSHADSDHVNAVPILSRLVQVDTLGADAELFQSKQPIVVRALQCWREARGSCQCVNQRTRLNLDEHVAISVLHPPLDYHTPHDNAASLVILVEYAGRRLLLTGDVEGEGLRSLLASSPVHCDVLLAPHHGALAANPKALGLWAQPQWVIASSADAAVGERLQQSYPQATCLSTAACGRIAVVIQDTGELSVEGWRRGVSGGSVSSR